MKLREYQQRAVESALYSLSSGRRPVVSLPTGSGKSLVLAAIASRRTGRTLVLSHRKELLLQDEEALSSYDPSVSTGIFSAGLGRRDTSHQVIFAGVASAYRQMDALQSAGKFGTVLIDEAHLVPREGSEAIMYDACLKALPEAGLCGVTATPYRLDSGLLCDGEGSRFDDLAIHIPPSTLVEQGYLSPLVGIGARETLDVDGVHVRQGDYIASELSQTACDEERIAATVEEILRHTTGRKSIITFAIDCAHAERVLAQLYHHREAAGLVTGKTSEKERDSLLRSFRLGDFRHLVNVGVLTTGFDAPRTDAVVMLRPTLSKGLYVQCLGRGMRLFDGKENCLVLDFGGNIARHGSLDMLSSSRLLKTRKEESRERGRAVDATVTRSARERQYQHATRAQAGDPMSGDGMLELPVLKMQFGTAPAKSKAGARNLVVDYCCEDGGGRPITAREWICVEYTGRARWHAEQWFARRGLQAPGTAKEALTTVRRGAKPSSISVRYEEYQGKMYPRVAIEHFEEAEEQQEATA